MRTVILSFVVGVHNKVYILKIYDSVDKPLGAVDCHCMFRHFLLYVYSEI